MTKKNVIFIVVDSVRFYKTGIDDRDRLDFMDKFEVESVSYTNAITSAPSSVMAAASMFTGMESAYLARNYNDWEFDTSNIISLQNTLEDNGYEIYSIDNSKEGREVTKDLTKPISSKYFPKGISHRNFWTNLEVNKVLKNILKNHSGNPSFFMMWYDCRNDPNTSYCLEEAINLFKEKKMYENSIIILTSDHGYPDPSTGLNKNTMRNMRHDMVVTDDNIKVPLFIKAPGIKARKEDRIVGHIDLFPTILNQLNLKKIDNISKIHGQDILKIKKDNRIIRSDTRLLLQKGRITSLRSKEYKLVYYHDENKTELYDLIKDPKEVKNLKIEGHYKNIYEKLEKYMKESNDKIDKYHLRYIEKRISDLINNININKVKNYKILILGNQNEILLSTIIKKIKQYNNNIEFYQITENNIQIHKKCKKLDSKVQKIDIGLFLTEKSHFSFDNPHLIEKMSKQCKKIYCYDYNLSPYNRFLVKWINPLIKYRRNFHFYKDDPILIYYDFIRITKNFINLYIRKKKILNPSMQEVKDLRDRSIRAKQENDKIKMIKV